MSVFEIDRPKRSAEHPIQKPVELVEANLMNSTKRGDVVFDPFLGSGSTAVACERLGRRCVGVEIDPIYFAVTLERLSDMGVIGERVDNGN